MKKLSILLLLCSFSSVGSAFNFEAKMGEFLGKAAYCGFEWFMFTKGMRQLESNGNLLHGHDHIGTGLKTVNNMVHEFYVADNVLKAFGSSVSNWYTWVQSFHRYSEDGDL